jgi:7-cyano-7-deazaguanine synthase in queuosine biosynthesis
MHNGVAICHPFAYIKKDWIIGQYYKHGIEDLLELTRSCEGEFEGIDYTTYAPGQYVPICGECFWCKEREWAMTCQDL